MPADAVSAEPGLPAPDARTSLHLLVADASRQLTICNSCRYCEGFCAVFPALERRTVLEAGDISQLANLCHDCRACFESCMYTPPHEFAVNVPVALTAARLADYRRYAWPSSGPRWLRGSGAGLALAGLASLVAVIVAIAHGGLFRVHGGARPSGPYDVVPYGWLLVLLLVLAVFALAVMAWGGRAYWQATATIGGRAGASAVARAVWESATLKYLRGGGEECYYPEDERPASGRRHLHGFVAYGFGLCLVSTISAGIMQDFLGNDPPYPIVSVPVLSGFVGGAAIAIGCLGLAGLKLKSSPVTSLAAMVGQDYALLIALAVLSLTGILTTVCRGTAAFGIVFLVHLAAILVAFAAAPYSKFVHLIYRFLALVRDNYERAAHR